MAYYIDTSAIVKLVVAETHSNALMEWIRATATPLVTSDLARTELFRVVHRVAPEFTRAARTVLETLVVLKVPTEVFEQAGRLDPPTLRTLDALHLSSALSLGDDLEGLVTYDERLAVAGNSYGIAIIDPR